METVSHVITNSGRNRKMASINDMLDDITEEILQREPFDQRTEVIVDSSLNYGLDLYQIVTGNETFDNNREKVQSDGIQFIEHQNAEEEEEENSISSEMNTFNQFFNEAVTQLQNNNNENVNSQKRPPSVDERRESEGHFSLRKIEAEFSKSDQKLKLLEKIKTIGNEKGWYKKVDNFTAKLMNDNITAGKDIPFQEYVEHVSDYCLKTMPRLIGDKIKSDVKDFVKQYSKPFDEIYQEAVAEAATITPEELLKMREYVVKTAPLKPEIIYIGGPAISYEISTQTNPMISESGSQTIEGLGTFDDKDFENIVKNNSVEVQMVIPPSADYHSEEEPGKMSAEAEEALKIKLETEVERQNRIKEDMRQALNPKFGLLLDPSYPDHQVLIKKLKNLTEFDLKIFEDSFVQQIDKTLPPPEILTLKWNEKMYKLVTFWTWTSPTIDEKLPIELRRKRVQKNEAAYLYIPPPPPSYPFDRTPPDFTEFECLFPIIKRRFGILEEYPTPPGVKKRRYCQSDEESDNDDKNDIEESSYLTYDQWHKKLASDSNSSFWRDSDEDDDGSSLDSFERFELSCPHRFGRNKKRSRNEGNEGQVTSEAEVVKEKEIIEVPVERVVTPEVTKDVEVEAVEIDEEENGENGENNFDGIESCDEEELWDDFIPERVFAEKCIYTNTYNVVDDFY